MLNESTYRSPKFLRNFFDFEINTGDDIKGEPSKKQIKKIEREKEKEKEKKLIEQWKEKWEKVNKSLFIEFYKKTFPAEEIVFRSDLDGIYKRWIGNYHLWTLYDKWIKEREEQIKIQNDLNILYDKIQNDFRHNPYNDKYTTPSENGKITFHYKFENGDTFILRNNELIYVSNGTKYTYIITLISKNKFIDLANSIVNDVRQRPRPRAESNSYKSKPKEENKYSAHPKGDLYKRLKETVELRKSQLSKMPKNHPDRKVLENELEAAQRAFDNLKSKYKFENLSSFYEFKF